MKYAAILMIGLLAISGTAFAGGVVHFEANVNGEVHTIDAAVGDDGSAVILVDGQPVEAPAAPGLPALPTLP